MALIDIVQYGGEPAVLELNRGDVGEIHDIVISGQIEIEIPENMSSGDYVFIS